MVGAVGLEPTQAYLYAADLQSVELSSAQRPQKIGRSCRIRTCDPLLPKQMRYQTALNSDDLTMSKCSTAHPVTGQFTREHFDMVEATGFEPVTYALFVSYSL